jgi:outer membrane protein assembly factor BamB
MQYTEDPEPTLTELWTSDALPGGSGSSPDLAAAGSRIYVNDNAGNVHALDATTGATIWSFPIGYASGGSPATSPDGLILPAGGGASPLLAVQDAGDHAELAWRRDDLLNRGIPTLAAGDRSYATVDRGQRRNDLVVIDTTTGEELDREPLPGTSVFSVGTTIGPDGTVYVPTIVGGLTAFRPG